MSAIALAGLGFGGLAWYRAQAEVARALEPFGKVAVLGSDAWVERAGKNAVSAASIEPLVRALKERTTSPVQMALSGAGLGAIVVPFLESPDGGEPADPRAVEVRLRALHHLPPLYGALLREDFAVYVPELRAVPGTQLRNALAGVARGVLSGAAPPAEDSFPGRLSRKENVELLVMLKEGSSPRLWRSSRGASYARALITASSAARDRWAEREQSMGGPLTEALGRLTVEVARFEPDGTLESSDARFLDRAITKHHGIGVEHRGAWKYVLPSAIKHGPGEPRDALMKLLSDEKIPASLLGTEELRVYRFALRTLAASAPGSGVALAPAEGAGDSSTPGEVAPASDAVSVP